MAETPTHEQPSSMFRKEMESFKSPEAKDVVPAPKPGSQAPSCPELPFPDGRLSLIVFLRHCGCPFAEKTFKILTGISHTHKDVHCVAVSHSLAEHTEAWIPQVGGVWDTDVIIDSGRDLYAQWGLGLSTAWGLLNPRALYSTYRLGADEGVWNRPTVSGSRWQNGGAFAVDRDGTVRWSHVCSSVDDIPDLNNALQSLGISFMS